MQLEGFVAFITQENSLTSERKIAFIKMIVSILAWVINASSNIGASAWTTELIFTL
jgi:hypothetical protein